MIGAPPSRGTNNPPNEYDPPTTFADEKSPINRWILGDDPFGNALDELIHGKTISERGLVICRTKELDDQQGCQVVFVAVSEERHLPEIFNGLLSSRAPIVGESPEFAERGGGIQSYIDEGRIRFSINVDAARRARLTASSKLLALARIVHDKNHSSED